ncbi:hypothetical protein DFA_08602 [Cavenderia fasciculata]|uniref:Uncharacterized protein n=1 Tax=Cavenderia fasciculata TaxID=261658 RepID=F4Q396_CACFS|nr:uncharacterized protein DFA_08602 [Cavenderia fasciculata]EGG17606.1 hypothetical protein DFA_08602 [Cavenderia fasciculata]|eukprot:XP_004356090.1 hypothetical protein DFA_08602 [Cavenderia fasciculata]
MQYQQQMNINTNRDRSSPPLTSSTSSTGSGGGQQQQQQPNNGHPPRELQSIVIKLIQLFAPPMQSKENTISYKERIKAILFVFVERFPHSSKSPIDDFSLYDQIQKKCMCSADI